MSRAVRMLRALQHPRYVAGRLLRETGLCRAFTVRTDLYRLRFFPTARSCAMWTNPASGKRDDVFFRRCLRAGDTVVDVGANVGALTLTAAALVGRRGMVWSVEADPRLFRYLAANVALNGFTNVCAIHAAAGAETDVRRAEDVPVRQLDDLVPEVPVRVLRISVDGQEQVVLRGARRLLSHTEYLYFEPGHGYDPGEVSRLLGAVGFGMFEVFNGALHPFTVSRGDRRNLVGLRVGDGRQLSPSVSTRGDYRRDEAC
jgi:hypothetical protein